MNKAAVVLFAVAVYIALPALMIWGWMRWLRRTQPRTTFSTLSLIGFTFATVSGLLAISAMLYARFAGGFSFYDPSLLRIYRWGAVLSIAGVIFAISGVWRPSPLRWHAPACAIGTLVFWLAAAAGE